MTAYFPITFNTFLAGNATIQGGNWNTNRGTDVTATRGAGFMYPESPNFLQAIAIGI